MGTGSRTTLDRRDRLAREPKLIEVRGVCKSFRIPDQRVDTVKERVLHPFRRIRYRELHALQDVSFDV
ncbi:MAG TPA: hypothetical protein VGF93_16795, partial [Solirubrobacteraceae bacterium]